MTPEVTVITGGAGGMGLATAHLADPGRTVLLCDLDGDRLRIAVDELEAAGVDARAARCDVTSRASVDEAFATAQELGDVVSVVHTAGLSPLMGSPRSIVSVNALGTVNVTEAAYALAGPGTAVVLVASMAGHLFPRVALPKRAYRLADTDPDKLVDRLTSAAERGPRSMHPGTAYGISKNFVIWYAARQAARFGERGARILSVSPGTFDTAMGRLEIASGSERILESAALRRFGTPREIAELLTFCSSSRASYLTGVDILCDGGTVAGLTLRDMVRLARGR